MVEQDFVIERTDKGYRADASQFFIAGELCRRGYVAVVTMGNCPNTDILCSDYKANRFVHIQVKTFVPGNKTCSIGQKSEIDYGENFFWVLGGIPLPGSSSPFEYYIIPSKEMAFHISKSHRIWASTPGKKGQLRNEATPVRTVYFPPSKHLSGWDISEYRNAWNLIAERLEKKTGDQ